MADADDRDTSLKGFSGTGTGGAGAGSSVNAGFNGSGFGGGSGGRSTSHASASNRSGGSGFSGWGGGSTSHASAAKRSGGSSFGSLNGGGRSYGSYSGPSRYGPPGQGSQGFRSLVNAVNSIGGTPEQRVANVLRNMGLGYDNPFSLAGMMGTFGHESTGFNPNALGDAGTAHGLAQWRNDRWGNMQDYARQMGVDPRDIAAQAAFAGHELQSQYPGAYSGVVGASSVPAAVAAMNAYEKPFGYTPGGAPENVAGWQDRVARATEFMGTPSPATTAIASLGQGIGPPGSAQATASPVYSNASAGPGTSMGSGATASATPSYPDAQQGSWLGSLTDMLGSGFEAAKTYGASYLDKAMSPENTAAYARAHPVQAMRLASAFGSLNGGNMGPRHPGEGGGQAWFQKPKSSGKTSKDKKDKPERRLPRRPQYRPPDWVFPTMITRPYTLA